MGCDTKVETSFPPPSDSNEVQGAEGDEGDDPADGHPSGRHGVAPGSFEGLIDPDGLAHGTSKAVACMREECWQRAGVVPTNHPLGGRKRVEYEGARVEGRDEEIGDYHRIGHHSHGKRRENLVGDLQREERNDGGLEGPEQKQHRR